MGSGESKAHSCRVQGVLLQFSKREPPAAKGRTKGRKDYYSVSPSSLNSQVCLQNAGKGVKKQGRVLVGFEGGESASSTEGSKGRRYGGCGGVVGGGWNGGKGGGGKGEEECGGKISSLSPR